ncbi:MAG: hypothetical protein IJA82_06795 [Clostridia bacterium]|nr:hypothetical protein [Clostridia bacterium]
MKKLNFINKKTLSCFWPIASGILAIFSLIALFIDFDTKAKWYFLGVLIFVLIVTYVSIYISHRKKKKVTLKIRQTKIVIKEGDIFEQEGKKLISFNEYFDTIVDDKIIAKGSLNGIFIENHVEDIKELDEHLKNELNDRVPKFVDEQRPNGKKFKYDLGTIVPYGDYLLLAYSRFDSNNRAYMNKEDIPVCYMNMWNEIDIYRASYSINMPLLGGKNFIRGISYTAMQWLELILWSFRVSEVNLAKNATLNIIIHESTVDEIDFLKLKDYSD